MLEIKNAKKTFNRGRIKAINNTSLSLEDTGLVALLGPSGCGKTTLLNSIGGLDKLNKGSIYINGKKINSKITYKKDKLRNINIGYIFQDYKLIENLTVYDNVAIVLKMLGIKDKKEIKTRVEYALDKVGMLRYIRRPASMLSGGERQRVAIARAIVKDPTIILADEPTGNLDSKNSLEIMKIIKSISEDRLVILVTHETNLAKFYADRIIEITDGTVTKDYINDDENELDYRIDNNIYLKDFDDEYKVKNEIVDLNIYSNKNSKLKLDIVVSNGNIYIRSNTEDKIEVVDPESNIELINDHYKTISTSEKNKYKFEFNKINKKKYSSILNPITLLIQGFIKVFDYSFIKKMLLLGFLLSGMFLLYAVSSISATIKIDDRKFVTTNKEYLLVNTGKIKIDDYLSYEKTENIDYIMPTNSKINMNVEINDYYQTSKVSLKISGSLSDINMINKDNLIYGNMPENNNEIVIDKFVIDNLFNDLDNTAKMSGITKTKDMLGRIVYLNDLIKFKIVGITDNNEPCIYTSKDMFITILSNKVSDDSFNSYYHSVDDENIDTTAYKDYNLYKDKIEIKKGNYPQNDFEVIINISNQENIKLNTEIKDTINKKKLKVVGYYDSKYNYNYYFVNPNMIKYNLIEKSKNITIKPQNKDIVLTNFKEKGLNIEDTYEKSRNKYLSEMKETRKNTFLVSGIILAISLIEVFLMIRSSFLSRIKEVGIYRAIGVKKIDIYKMFFGEIFAITTIASVPGIILMSYILKVLTSISYIKDSFIINPFIILVTIIFIYIFNLIIGLLPVYKTIRKTPANILSRHDLD